MKKSSRPFSKIMGSFLKNDAELFLKNMGVFQRGFESLTIRFRRVDIIDFEEAP